ncbi:hypothetical protein PS2_045240 [Malus domestica]
MGGKVTLLIIYVDDMVVTGDDTEEVKRLQRYLSSEFEIQDLGGLKYFLGIEVARSRDGIYLCQCKYVLDLLSETGMLACKPAETPIVQNHHLAIYQDQIPTNKERYQSRNAYIELSERCTWERINFQETWTYGDKGYTDADWAGNITDCRSTSGYFTFVAGNLVTWRSKKQNVVARSTAEAEYRGIAHGICELLWIQILLTEIGFKPRESMLLYCDNQAAREIANNPVQHDRTKHVEVDRHFIKEKLDVKLIDIPYVKSEEQLADVLTHAVSVKVFQDSLDKLGLSDIYAPT